MRIPLTRYGLPEVLVYPAVVAALMIVVGLIGVAFLPTWAVASIEIMLTAVAVWLLSFFRDPQRPPDLLGAVQADDDTLLAPADGRITDVELVQENELIGTSALRIGIFLSIFDTHINRSPCNAKVEKITFKPGKYKNAADPRSGQVNESNDLDLVRTDSPKDRLVVRQISGAIARRIVCQAREGQELAAGEKFGMIKFGSRTELYVPVGESCMVNSESCVSRYTIHNTQYTIKCLVKIGDKVKAGLTPIVKYEIPRHQ
jgi:phosphatidylserine decarboxylase